MQFCVSASDGGGQQGSRCDRKGGTGLLGAATAGRQGDFLTAVQCNREDAEEVQNHCLVHCLTPYITDTLNHRHLADIGVA